MEFLVIFVTLLAIWLLFRTSALKKEAHETREQVSALIGRIRGIERKLAELNDGTIPEAVETRRDTDSLKQAFKKQREELLETIIPPAPPPLPFELEPEKAPAAPAGKREIPATTQKDNSPAPEPQEAFSLEKFMGVKLFAWLGGVAMFFGVIFFVKYAFEKNLIPPALRIALGFVTGAGLLVGGLCTHRLVKYRVLAQTLCATGVLILYGVSFAAHAIYHFDAFGTVQTFAVMAVVTAVAFLTAVRLEALVVAVLGMLGGFLTPILLSTGQDQVFGLFGYITFFGGNFARDMTYSIAWGLFSLGLLGIGIWARSKQARYAAIGLLAVTLLKLFVHDLAAIENIFRIIALIGVAVIAFVTSFLYQRFFDRTEQE